MIFGMAALAALSVVSWQALHRTAPLVQRWRASSFPRRAAGSLSVRDSGSRGRSNEEVIVLLHGLGATGDYFGDFYDALGATRRVVIVDLLGFGQSLDEDRTDFGVDAHVAAFDDALRALDLGESNVVLAAHSMSSAIALTWADRHPARTIGVYLWAPPVYPVDAAGNSVGKEYGVMGRLFALDTKWAELACRINCWNRDLSGRAMALMAPRWPMEVSSRASRHTWSAYHGSLRSLILDFDWKQVLPASVPVTIFHGTEDPIGDQEYLVELADGATIVNVPGADHHVALEHPELLLDSLDSA